MRIAIASDHAGYQLKDWLGDHLRALGHDISDHGGSAERCDYPPIAAAVGGAVSAGDADFGVLVCGSGIGVSIAANKVPGVRAALVSEPLSARLAREHNDANVLSLGARMHTHEEAVRMVETFVTTNFSGDGRHTRRIEMLSEYERTGELPPVPGR